MFAAHRLAHALVTAVVGGLVASAFSTALVERHAHAQISGTLGGDFIAARLLAEEGIFYEVPPGATALPADRIANGLPTAVADGTSNTMMSGYAVALQGNDRASISADVTTVDAAGGTHTARIIAILIGLHVSGAPGFMDYTDDACMLANGAALDEGQRRSCARVSHGFRAFVEAQRAAVSPLARMSQAGHQLVIWDPNCASGCSDR